LELVLPYGCQKVVHGIVWVFINEPLDCSHSVEVRIELEGDIGEESSAQKHREFELPTVHFCTYPLSLVCIFIQLEPAFAEIGSVSLCAEEFAYQLGV